MTFYLGVDGGGSHTLAVVTDSQGRVRGHGAAGPGNHQINEELAFNNIDSAIRQALKQAGLQREDIARACFGLAGADREADFRILRPMIRKLGYDNSEIVCDTIIALRAGTNRSYGVVVICGFGMNCAGIGKTGEVVQCGGFGYEYGDFGGGRELAIEAFRSAIRSWEGRTEATLLADMVPQALGCSSVPLMYDDFLDHGRTIPPSLAEVLFRAAELGDETAIRILRIQGRELGMSARAVIQRLGLHSEVFDLVLAGSILTKGDSKYTHPYIAEEVRKIAPGCRLKPLTFEPVAGALLLAMDKDDAAITEEVYSQFSHLHHLKGAMSVE
ncbi:ATPase [Cohnella sp. CIP 111063]|uniref:N-acetylglucosamine kinase n=1 Tax=unclassified Cohnella TaxID=2636738 RepID=UPI000B8C1FEA|nr:MULTISPECIES: BadF/BadG/BcrA/BcrD ATPase family protein [unclassified Cohnella]OXS54761.1 ATPase [Cohnella sp. CIP 111063]PRX64599.1 N-acetylglucosamine kinase-like BadF-type ATPase [Cohnella sp. SGD-V74]